MAGGRCSFCAKTTGEVGYLVTGPRGVAICDECASVADHVASEALKPSRGDMVLTGLSSISTMDERRPGVTGEIPRAAIVTRRGRITWLGPEEGMPRRYRELPDVDCGGRIACPGFVDASARLLTDLDGPDNQSMVERMLGSGITAMDVRAGGTGERPGDLRLLTTARAIGERLPLWLSVTWVAGDLFSDAEMFSAACRLASSVEVTCGGTGIDRFIERAGSLPVRVIACRKSDDGCLDNPAMISIGGWSARLAHAAVQPPIIEAAAVLEGSPLPGRPLWDAGVRCALATGSGWEGIYLEGMSLVAALGGGLGALDAGEVLWSITRGGAMATGDRNGGRLRMGDPADVVVLDTDSLSDITRRPDSRLPWKVMVAGAFVPELQGFSGIRR